MRNFILPPMAVVSGNPNTRTITSSQIGSRKRRIRSDNAPYFSLDDIFQTLPGSREAFVYYSSGQVMHLALVACDCPPGSEYSTTTRSCEELCPEGEVYHPPTGSCYPPCGDGSYRDPSGTCVPYPEEQPSDAIVYRIHRFYETCYSVITDNVTPWTRIKNKVPGSQINVSISPDWATRRRGGVYDGSSQEYIDDLKNLVRRTSEPTWGASSDINSFRAILRVDENGSRISSHSITARDGVRYPGDSSCPDGGRDTLYEKFELGVRDSDGNVNVIYSYRPDQTPPQDPPEAEEPECIRRICFDVKATLKFDIPFLKIKMITRKGNNFGEIDINLTPEVPLFETELSCLITDGSPLSGVAADLFTSIANELIDLSLGPIAVSLIGPAGATLSKILSIEIEPRESDINCS